MTDVRQKTAGGRSPRRHWLDLKQEARSAYESAIPEFAPGGLEKSGPPRVWAFARAMFFRLTLVRRVVLLLGILLLLSSAFLFGGSSQLAYGNRLLLGALCLLVVLALELADRVSLKRDLEVARDIQNWLVPRTPPELPGLDIAFRTRPANTVAGDYYDVLPLPGGGPSVLFVVADVAGKGIPAGLVMACFRTCLHTLVQTSHDLGGVVANLQRCCCEDSLGGRRFTSAFLAQYEAAGHTLSYVNAGHNPPLLRRASGSIVELKEGGVPFGTFPNAAFELGRLSVGSGDLLLMYTDGVVEAANEAGDEYGLDRLRAFVREAAGSAAECQQQLLASIDAFTARAPQHDDITCLIVQFSS